MPKEREGREKRAIGGAVLISSRGGGGGGGSRDCGPIAAGLCPELLAVCRRGCRPERGTPPPPNTRSS